MRKISVSAKPLARCPDTASMKARKRASKRPEAFDAVMLPAAEAISCFDTSKTCEGGKRIRPVFNHRMSAR